MPAVVEHQCTRWHARPDGDAGALTDRLFVPRRWARRAVRLRDELDAVTAGLGEGAHGLEPAGFVVGAAALRHVRADPLLPPELLPGDWPGDGLRAAYREYREAFGLAAAEWFGRQAG
jgi:phenylacetic acid degradation operon negative regulatory protein